jgi:transcriptional regulator with XRE-family HTH domain
VYHPKVHKKIARKRREKLIPVKFPNVSSDLKIFHTSRGLSQSQLAELSGTSKSTISMVEYERRELPGQQVTNWMRPGSKTRLLQVTLDLLPALLSRKKSGGCTFFI